MQYNYAHHNEGGGLLCCNLKTPIVLRDCAGNVLINKDGEPLIEKLTGKWLNNYIYKNYFLNNGTKKDKSRSAFLTIAREVAHSTFVENIIICDPQINDQSIINTEDESTYCYGLNFINNVFYAPIKSGQQFTIKMILDSSFINNRYHNVQSIDNTSDKLQGTLSFNKFTGNLDNLQTECIFERQKNAQRNLQLFAQYMTNGGSDL